VAAAPVLQESESGVPAVGLVLARQLSGGQCPSEEPAGGEAVTAGRGQYVDDLSVLVDPSVT